MPHHLTALPTEIITCILEKIALPENSHTIETVSAFHSLMLVGNHLLHDISIGFLYREVWLNTTHDHAVLKRLITNPHLATKVRTIFVYPMKMNGETAKLAAAALPGMKGLRSIDWPDNILIPSPLSKVTTGDQSWSFKKYRCVRWW